MGTIWPPDLAGTEGPKYIVLIQSLRNAIRAGELTQGAKLPPVRELAWQLGITPGTVARAYKAVTDEGLLEAVVGRGTFVAAAPAPRVLFDEPLLPAPADGDLDFRACRVAELGQGAAIRRALAQMARAERSEYADYPSDRIEARARRAVCDWIGPDRAGRLAPDDIVLGLGAQHCTILAMQTVLTGASPVVLTEELAYPGTRNAIRMLRGQQVGVEIDQHGLRPDRLEETLRRHGGQVLLTSAEVHSPTTACTPLERRLEIADIARRYHVQIIEDDCHCITRPDTPSYRALAPERGWYVGSLTKSVSAAVRFGYMACPATQAPAARHLAQSAFYSLPSVALEVCVGLLESGQAAEIQAAMEKIVLDRVRVAVNILGQWDIRWRPDTHFVWLNLPQGWRGSTFARACEAQGIRIKSADEFALPDGRAPNAVRLALNANIAQDQYEAALRKISDLLARPPANLEA